MVTQQSPRRLPQTPFTENAPPLPQQISWGGIPFMANYVPMSLSPSVLQGLRTGAEVERSGRDGVETLAIDDLSKGFMPMSGFGSWGQDKGRTYINQGVIVHVPGTAALAYKNTTVADLIAADFSGMRAANKRLHSAMFASRWYGFLDVHMIKDTSTSDPTLVLPTSDGITEKVTAVAVLTLGGTNYLVTAGSTTDDIQGTTDPSASTPTWAKVVTLSGTPYINAIAPMNHLGSGWFVVIGNPTGTAGVWAAKNSASLPATLSEVVLASVSDQTNLSNSTLNTGAKSPTAAIIAYYDTPTGTNTITNPTNVLASDGNYAAYPNATTAAATTVYGVFVSGFDFSAIPDNADIVGITAEVERKETDAAVNAFDNIINFAHSPRATFLAGVGPTTQVTTIGENKADATEWATADAYFTYGGAADRWSTDLTTDLIKSSDFGLFVGWRQASVAAQHSEIDHIRLTVHYRLKGATTMPVSGGFTCGPLPNNPSLVPVIEPESADLTGITVRRLLKYYEFTYDATADHLHVDVSYPATGINYCGVMCHFQGGVAVAGGSNETVWNQVKLVGSDGQTRNLRFPTIHGTEPQTITKMEGHGNALIVDVADTDGGNAQQWIYENEKWNALGVLQSIANTIATEPILWAETVHNLKQDFDYRFFPVSTTALAGARWFLPSSSDIYTDPHVVNTTQVKTDGSPYVQVVRLDGGAPESLKTLLTAQLQSFQVDDNTSYGTVGLKIGTSSDLTLASPAVSMTFGTGGSNTPGFTVYNVKAGTNDPGVDFNTLTIRLTLGHQTNSAETPNPLPLILNFVGQWEDYEIVPYRLSVEHNHDIMNIVERIKTLKRTKNVQRLLGGSFNDPAAFIDAKINYRPGLSTTQPTSRDVISADLYFRITPGSVA